MGGGRGPGGLHQVDEHGQGPAVLPGAQQRGGHPAAAEFRQAVNGLYVRMALLTMLFD